MVDSFVANETLRRLIIAAERGVSIVIFIDNLNTYPNVDLINQLVRKGAII